MAERVFTCVKFAGPIFGADLVHHDLFKIERTEGPPFYGEYFLIPVPGTGNDFNVGVRLFGYIDRFNVGNLHRRARERFASEECVAAEKAIHVFFSNPNIFKDKFLRPVRFLGGVEFQPGWIVQGSLESIWMFPRASRMSDTIYVGDFLGSDTTGTATNTKGKIIKVESVATQIRGLAVDARAPANIWAILDGFSADAKGKAGLALYRGSVGSLSAREVALRNANQTGSDILDKTERGKLLINEEVMEAICDLLVRFYQLQGLGCLAAIQAAHKAIGPEPDYPNVVGQRPPQLH